MSKSTKPATVPSLSRDELRAHLETTEVREAIARGLVGVAHRLVGDPKEFASGSVGYHSAEKLTAMVNGQPTKFQVNLTITAVGSKNIQ